MSSLSPIGSLRRFDYRSLDLRALAEPLAVLSPIALVIGFQEAVMSLVALLFVLNSLRSRDFSWAREGWFAALLALWAYELVRTLVGHPTATSALTALQWLHFPLYAAALAYWILPEERARQRLLLASAAAMTFYGLDCLLQFALGFDIIGMPTWGDRLTSIGRKPGVGIQMAWLVAAPALGLWQRGWRAFAVFLGLVCLVAVLLSGDRMALLLLLSAAVLIALLAPRLRKGLLIAAPVVAALLAAILYFSPASYHRQVESTAQTIGHFEQSHYGMIFKSALDIARDHPVFGVGMHNFQAACVDPRYGPERVGPDELSRCPGHPHNAYLQWLAEGGLVGLILFLAFVVLTLRRLIAWLPENRDNLIFYGLAVSLALRFWPLTSGTSFIASWSAEPLFLVLGWAMAYCAPGRGAAAEAGRAGLSAPVAHVSQPGSVGV